MSVCLPPREGKGRVRKEQTCGGHLIPDSKGLSTWCPGWDAAPPHPEGCLGTRGALDGGGVRKGETVWVGGGCESYKQSVRLRMCQVSEPRRVASDCGQGVCGSRAGAGECGGLPL